MIVAGARRVGRRRYDSPELLGIRDVDDILDILSGLQIPLDERRSGD